MNRLFILREPSQYAAMSAYIAQHWQSARHTQPLAVEIKPWNPRRTKDQNKRYWAIVGELAEQVKMVNQYYRPEAWHEYFKRRFIGVLDLPNGGCVGMSSADLDVEKFGVFMTQVEAYAVDELNCVLTI